MATQIGIITEIESNGQARVLTDRKGACGGCHPSNGSGCRSCLAGAKFESRATNAIGAQPGDLVKIMMDTKTFLKGAAMLYLFPVAALLAGALAGTWIAGQMGLSTTAGGVLGSIAAIGIAVFFLIRLDRNPSFRKDLKPDIVEVVHMNKHHACR